MIKRETEKPKNFYSFSVLFWWAGPSA